MAHRGHSLSAAQRQRVPAADNVHGEPAIVDRQGPGPRPPVRVLGIFVHILLDTGLLAGVIRHVETQTRRVDEKLTRRDRKRIAAPVHTIVYYWPAMRLTVVFVLCKTVGTGRRPRRFYFMFLTS